MAEFEVCLCVSKVERSPETAELKCFHENGKNRIESETVIEVSGNGFG
jgi:hypothetical protein